MAVLRCPVELASTQLKSSAFNVWHIRTVTGSEDPGPAMDALHAFYTACAPVLAGNLLITFPDSLVDVTDQTEVTPASKPANIIVGTGGFTEKGLAITVSWKTSLRARRARGRTFVGPLNQASIADTGFIANDDSAAVTTAAQALLDASEAAAGWSLGVWGQESKGIAEPKVLRDFTGFTVSSVPAHLRSRRD